MNELYLLKKEKGENKYSIISSGNDLYTKHKIHKKHIKSYMNSFNVLAQSVEAIPEKLSHEIQQFAGHHYNAYQVLSTQKLKQKKFKNLSIFEIRLLYSKKFSEN